ncbi:MAG: hypothetical protein JSV79_04415, partial [Armatimonadota bacterium]
LAPPYAKPMAVLFYLLIAALTVLDVALDSPPGSYSHTSGLGPSAAIYLLLAVGLGLSVAVTPGRGQFAKGVRHSRKLGLSYVPAWGDAAANWAPLAAFGAVLLAAVLAVALLVNLRPYVPVGVTAAAGVATLTLLYFGYAKQSLDLAYPRNSGSYLTLLLFVLWALPLLIGMLVAVYAADGGSTKPLFAMSPLAGVQLALSEQYRFGWSLTAKTAIMASLLPAVVFALLCTRVVRRTAAEITPAP